MIISHSKKFCYWKIARTGSNTAELCLRMSGVLDLSQDIVTSCHFFPSSHNVRSDHESGHTTPAEAVVLGYLTQAEYDAYDHYTIVRDPIERWMSAYGYRMRMHSVEYLTPTEFFNERRHTDVVQRKQTEYIDSRTKTFPFSDYESSIRQLMDTIGGEVTDIPKIKHQLRKAPKHLAASEIATTQLGQRLREYYSDDLKLQF